MKVARNPSRRFVIFCRARTGSYLLVDLLNQHSDINCYGEVFKSHKVELPNWAAAKLTSSTVERDKAPITFVNSMYALTPRRITGLKVFHSHNEVVRHYLAETRNIKKVILTRAPIDSFLSLQRAKASSEWVRRIDRNKPRPTSFEKIHFDPAQFEHYLEIVERFDQWISDIELALGEKFYRISYDEVAAIEPVRQLARFLGSNDDAAELKPKLEKQINLPLEELVDNFDEMMTYLKDQEPKNG